MAKIIKFRKRRVDGAQLAAGAEQSGDARHPSEVIVFEGVSLHDLWVRWAGREPDKPQKTGG